MMPQPKPATVPKRRVNRPAQVTQNILKLRQMRKTHQELLETIANAKKRNRNTKELEELESLHKEALRKKLNENRALRAASRQ